MASSRLIRLAVVAQLALCLSDAGLAVAQFVYDGPDRLVSGEAALNENLAYAHQSIAKDAAGNFIVVWDVFSSKADEFDVFARRFAADGAPSGPDFRVNAMTPQGQLFAAVAVAADGRFVVAWDDRLIDSPLGNGPSNVGARVFDAAGNPVTGDLAVNTFTAGHQSMPSVAMAPDGRFVVLWTSGPQEIGVDPEQDGSESGVFGQLYDAGGVPDGAEFAVNTYTPRFQQEPSVAMRSDGSFVAVWDGYGPGALAGVFARAFDAAGTPVGPEFPVEEGGPSGGGAARIATDSDGSFVVAWQVRSASGNEPDGDGSAVLARRFDASANPLTPQFLLNGYTTGEQLAPTVAVHGDGTFTAVWQDSEQFRPGGERAVIRRFDANGTPLGAETQASYGGREKASVVALSDGRAIVVTQGPTRLGSANAPYLIAMQGLCDPASGCTPDDGCSADSDDATIKMKSVGVDPDPTDDTVSIRGAFDLPHGATLSDFLDRFTSGVDTLRIVVASENGTVRSDDSLTALTGELRARSDGTVVVVKDKSGSVNGIRSVTLKVRRDLGDLAPDRVQLKLKAKGGSFPVVPGDEPLSVTLELAGRSTCGPETFTPAACSFDSPQTSLVCR